MCSLYLGDQIISGQATLVGESRNIGQIIPSTIPLTDAGLHLLDGALIQGSGVYSDFVDYIASIYDASANYFCSEANWQTAVTTYGVCGKFVYDSVNNTVRLPKYSNKIYTSDINPTAPVVGNGTSLGVTDGTKNASIGASPGGFVLPTTSTFGSNVGTTYTASYITSGKSLGVTTDPTKSGIIADLSNITASLEGYYYIVVATSTKTSIEVDIDNVVTDLNNKADKDLSNVTNYLPSGTTITVGTSSARFSTLADAFSYLSGKWSDGYVTISITTNLTVTGDLELITSDFNIPLLIINGNSHTITLNFTTANTYTCGFRIYNQKPVQVTNVNFVGGTNGTTHILAGGYYTSSLLFSSCSFDNAYGGVFAYNVADVKVEGCTLLALSVGMQAQQGGTVAGRGNTFGASGKKCTSCYSLYLGGIVRDGESTYTNYTNKGTQNTNTITSNGLIMLA